MLTESSSSSQQLGITILSSLSFHLKSYHFLGNINIRILNYARRTDILVHQSLP